MRLKEKLYGMRQVGRTYLGTREGHEIAKMRRHAEAYSMSKQRFSDQYDPLWPFNRNVTIAISIYAITWLTYIIYFVGDTKGWWR